MNTKKITAGIIIIVLIALAFVYIKDSSDTRLRIGVINVLSGDKSVFGKDFERGLQLARDVYSKVDIEFITIDDGYDGRKGLEGFQKIKDDIDAIIIVSTPSAQALYAEAKKTNLPVLMYGSPDASDEKDNIFNLFPDPVFADVALGRVMKGLNVSPQESIVGVYTNEPRLVKFYEAFQQSVGADLEEYGLDAALTSQADIKDTAKKVLAHNPKYIFMTNLPHLGAQFVKEYVSLLKGKSTVTFVFDMTFNEVIEEYKQILGSLGSIEGSFVISPKVDSSNFTDDFQEKYNEKPGELAEYGYDALVILASTYVPERMEWLKNIEKISIKGAIRDITFDELGRRIPAFAVTQLKEGKIP